MKNIVLTGFMGTGKTTVGKILAKKLNREFVDTDAIIEEKLGATISEIFKSIGEPKFREFEVQTIALISRMDNCVISCGGGAAVDPRNIENLRKNGVIFNLYASADHILKRLGKDDTRPLIKKMTNPFEQIVKLLAQRKKAYEQCDFRISTEDITPEEVAEKIAEQFFGKLEDLQQKNEEMKNENF